MRAARVALFSLLGIVAVLAIAVIVVLSIDLGRYQPFVEKLASDALGRQFRIEGAFEPSVGRTIRVVAENIRLANAEWSDDETLIFISRLDIRIDTWSLISGPVIIESLSVAGTRIALEKLDDGRNNWTFFEPGMAEPAASTEPVAELPVLVKDLQVSDFELTYESPSRRRPLHVALDEVTGRWLDSQDLELRISGQLNDTPVSVTAVAGKFDNLVALEDVRLNIEGALGEISFQGDAVLDELLKPRRPTGQLAVTGPNAEYLTEVLALEPVTSGPLDLNVSISPAGDRIDIAARGVFGEFTIDAGGSFTDLQHPNDLDIKVTAAGPNAGTIGRLAGNDSVPEDPFHVTAVARIAGRNIEIEAVNVQIGNTRFDASGTFTNFPSPDGASMTLDIAGPDFGRFNKLFGLPGKLTGPFKLEARLAELPDNNASVRMIVDAHGLSFTVDGTLVNQPGFVGSTMHAAFNGKDFDVLAQAAGLSNAPSVDFDVRISAEMKDDAVQLSNSFARVGEDKLLVNGHVGNDPLKHQTDLTFEAEGPDLKGSLVAFGAEATNLEPGPWSAKGRIFREQDHFVVQGLQAVIGADREYLLTADGRITDDPKRTGSTGIISVNGRSLAALADTAGLSGMPNARFKVTADIEKSDNGYRIPKARIELGEDSLEVTGLVGDPPLLKATDIRFKLQAADLQASLAGFGIPSEKVPSGRFLAGGGIRKAGDDFALPDFSASLAGTELQASGRVGAWPAFDRTDLDIRLDGDNLSSLLPLGEAFDSRTDDFSVRGKLQLSNNTLSIGNADVRFGEARLNGALSTSLEPLLSKGTFVLQANTPDFGHLVRAFAEHVSAARVPMTFKTKGNWDDNFWSVEELLLTVADGSLSVAGTLDGPPNFENTDIRLDLHIDNARNLSGLVGRELPSEAVTLRGRLIGTQTEMTLADFVARLGESDIDGQFELRDGDTPSATIRIVSQRLDVSGYLPPLDEPAKKAPAKTSSKRIPDTPLPLDLLRKFDASVDVRFGELTLRQRPLIDVRLLGSVQSGALSVSDFSLAGTDGGSLSGGVRLKPDGSKGELLLRVSGRKLSLGLRADTPEEFDALPDYDFDLVLQGTGATVAEVAGSSNGYLRLVSGPGRTRGGSIRAFTQDILFELLNSLNPFSETDPYTNVKCFVVLMKTTDGILTGKPAMVLQTDKLNAFANANVDLKTEKLDVDLNMVPQTGIGIGLSDLVTPYTKVGGTLAKPVFMLDPESALIEGTVVVATAGLSFLARRFKERYLTNKDACGTAVADTVKEFTELDAAYRFD